MTASTGLRSAMRGLARKTLVRHTLVAILAMGLVLGFAAVHAQFSPMHRWNRAFGDASLVLIALSMVTIGNGFFKPNISTIVSEAPLTTAG